jgi:hypothetical protein
VFGPEDPAKGLEVLAEKRLGLVELATGPQHAGEVVGRAERVRVVRAQEAATDLQVLAKKGLGLVEFAARRRQAPEIADGS